jgi:hypothetical protein
MVDGTWYTVHGAWYMVHGTWHMVFCTWHKVHGTWQMVHGTWHTVHGTWHKTFPVRDFMLPSRWRYQRSSGLLYVQPVAVTPCRCFGTTQWSNLLGWRETRRTWPWMMGLIGFPEPSRRNHHCTLRNVPEERKFAWLLLGIQLNSAVFQPVKWEGTE